ncbi:MAG TPA: OPT family oligopeptide transporter [Burkholderiales bacterium]|nr:OPT family oligopeptide transporter [Burkholderiales bacterium]
MRLGVGEAVREERELTLRSLATGVLLGAALAPCNVYSGLKIGWSFNMSIIALLVALAFWRLLERTAGVPHWTLKESNIGQTAASSAASIISGGLVAPIPAYALVSGQQLATLPMIAWVFAVSFLGVWVAWYLRPALIVDAPLRFPAGVATLETMRDVFGHGREALLRIAVLFGAGIVSGLTKLSASMFGSFARWAPSQSLERLTFGLEPSLLLIGFGAIIGLRVGLSLALGALLAWGIVAPALLDAGLVDAPVEAGNTLFGPLVEWLLWPGVSLMAASTFTAFAVRWARNGKGAGRRLGIDRAALRARGPAFGFALAALLAVMLQTMLFDISLWMALLAIPLAVLLASVAARVVGETGIPPIGAIGKLSQLGFGVAAPGQIVTNLMTANVAGGAAGQCADLLNDFKVGHAIGAVPGRQTIAQCCGVAAGSVAGVLVYVALIPDPAAMLLSEAWPAPAVATWKAVAEALTQGLGSVPPSARIAMLAAAALGVVLGLLETRAQPSRWLPSGVALGLAFVIPASISLMMCLGALIAWAWLRWDARLANRFALAAAAGLIAGESIVGVVASFWEMASR